MVDKEKQMIKLIVFISLVIFCLIGKIWKDGSNGYQNCMDQEGKSSLVLFCFLIFPKRKMLEIIPHSFIWRLVTISHSLSCFR